MEKRMIDPAKWDEFQQQFSERNFGRRVRVERFGRRGVSEEDMEGAFVSLAVANGVAEIKRKSPAGREVDYRVEDVRGISTQLDSDGSENTLEFMDTNGDMTVLHFESRVDGDS